MVSIISLETYLLVIKIQYFLSHHNENSDFCVELFPASESLTFFSDKDNMLNGPEDF